MTLDIFGAGFAFTAGILALFSPCGFPLLPGYVSYYLGSEKIRSRAAFGGFICTLGLLAIFSAVGVLSAALGEFILPYISLFEIFAGALVIFLGVSMLVGMRLPTLQIWTGSSGGKGFAGLFFFGVAYGLGTTGCTTPIFLSLLVYSMTAGGFLESMLTFILYALGIGVPMIAVGVLVAEAKNMVISKIIGLTPWLYKVAGVLLVAIGTYLILDYYVTQLIF